MKDNFIVQNLRNLLHRKKEVRLQVRWIVVLSPIAKCHLRFDWMTEIR